MSGTPGHKLETIIFGRCKLMSITAWKAGTGPGLLLRVSHYQATDFSALFPTLFPISQWTAPWTTYTLQSPTVLTHILRQVCGAISTPAIMSPGNVKVNRRNMEFSFLWAHSPERSPGGSVSWHHYDWIFSNCIIMYMPTVSDILQIN